MKFPSIYFTTTVNQIATSFNAGTGTNMPQKVTIAWIEAADVKLKFLEIIEIFEACGNPIYCSCEAVKKL